MAKRYLERKALAIKLLGGKCIKCDSVEDLQFDHVKPRKKTGAGFVITKKLAGVAERKLETEIRKCQLLCGECHSRKSIIERGYKISKGQHGTISTYRYCKCAECRRANAEYKRKWKMGRKC
jgi:5-methylcytosine-specific restriction endonuclease McrA